MSESYNQNTIESKCSMTGDPEKSLYRNLEYYINTRSFIQGINLKPLSISL